MFLVWGFAGVTGLGLTDGFCALATVVLLFTGILILPCDVLVELGGTLGIPVGVLPMRYVPGGSAPVVGDVGELGVIPKGGIWAGVPRVLLPSGDVAVGLGVWLPASPGGDGSVWRVVPGVVTTPGVGAGRGEGTMATCGCPGLGLI